MARMLLGFFATLLLGAHSHPAGLECGTDATTRLRVGQTIMKSTVADAPADASVKVEFSHWAKVTITAPVGTYLAAKAFGKDATLHPGHHSALNLTSNCSNQVYTASGNSTTYTFWQHRADSIVVGYASAPGVVSLVTAKAPEPHHGFCFAAKQGLHAIYADMHDGDKKEITISGTSMTIKPSGNNQTWIVTTQLDAQSCSAVVDFNVPGKPNPPPVKLTASLWNSVSSQGEMKTELEFTDPSETLPAGPLNRWVQLSQKDTHQMPPCPTSLKAIYADMHDGDKKEITITGTSLTIKPNGNNQTWVVKSQVDTKSCSAVIDFNVPGKPGPPPLDLKATLWATSLGKEMKTEFEFTDPSGTLAAADFPLNHWVEIKKEESGIEIVV